jgi:hypothetical protein
MAERALAPARRLDALGCALLAFAVYLLLAQDSFYRTDGLFIVKRLVRGEVIYNNHFLYMPLLVALRAVTAPLRLAAHEVALLFSALGAAGAVALVHATCRHLGAARLRAIQAALVFAVLPPVLFFATVVEFHAPFLACAQAAVLLHTLAALRPGIAIVLASGAVSALAFTMHTSGLLLPAVTVPWMCAVRIARGGAPGRALGQGLAALGAHAVCVVGALVVLRALGFPEFPPAYDRGRLGEVSLSSLQFLPRIAWEEWWWAYLPVSLALPLALFARATRGRGIALATGAGAFLLLSLTLLSNPPRPELGAYLLPVAFAAVVTMLEIVPALPVLAIAAALAVAGVLAHDVKGPVYAALEAGYREAAPDGRAVLWIADEDELVACLTRLPGVEWQLLSEIAARPPTDVEPQLPALDAIVEAQRARGREVLLTARALEYLGDPAPQRWGELLPSGPLLVRALQERFALVPVRVDDWRAFRLRGR